jgi:hypothetical protein
VLRLAMGWTFTDPMISHIWYPVLLPLLAFGEAIIMTRRGSTWTDVDLLVVSLR